MRYGFIVTAAAAVVLGATGAAAQTSVDVSFTARIPQILHIENTGGVFTFNDATDTDFENAYMASITGPTLRTRGNVAYKVVASAPDLTTAPDVGTKPAGDVTVRTDAGATTAALSNAGTDFYTGARGGNLDKVVAARMALAWATDQPATYSTTVTFTITTP